MGESGCGKSMTALSLMRLLPEAGRIAGGRVELGGVDLLGLPEAAMRAVRGKRVSMIFQEPATALNPVLTVGAQIAEVIVKHHESVRRYSKGKSYRTSSRRRDARPGAAATTPIRSSSPAGSASA